MDNVLGWYFKLDHDCILCSSM